MSLPRRKSCVACARGKRRCDLGFPECGRCLGMRVTCVYTWISPEGAQELVQSRSSNNWVPQEIPQNHHHDQNGLPEEPLWDCPLPGPDKSRVDVDVALGPLLPLTVPSVVSPALAPLLDEIMGPGKAITFVNPDLQIQSPNISCLNIDLGSYAPRASQDNVDPDTSYQVTRHDFVTTGSILRARAEYAASRLALQIRALAEAGQTAFIHRTQTEASPILRDALAVCCLAVLRNSSNAFLARLEIARRAELLVEATETAISLAPPNTHSTTNLDLLPAVQAMLMYQCMRLFFSDNIAQQAQAERDAEPLAKWVGILQGQPQRRWKTNVTGTELNSSVWKEWIRSESIRRTVIFADLVASIYTVLRSGRYQPSGRITKLSFIGQAALWEARSVEEWRQATGKKPWLEINMSNFHHDIKAALPDDLDELGIIIRASYEGIDRLKDWLSGDIRLLEKWGLRSIEGFDSSS